MDQSFVKALNRLLLHEGGYVNNPRDNGGETYKGVSRRWYPKWGGWDIIDSFSDKQAIKSEKLDELVAVFYYTVYWYKLQCHKIDNEFIAELVFNFAVNMGKKVVIKKVQRVLGVAQDGLIGDITIGALNATNVDTFVYHFILEVIEFYILIGKKQPHFLLGWLNRAISEYYRYENLKQ